LIRFTGFDSWIRRANERKTMIYIYIYICIEKDEEKESRILAVFLLELKGRIC
jgi:hypothetical protein